jgi:hypothetical protein
MPRPSTSHVYSSHIMYALTQTGGSAPHKKEVSHGWQPPACFKSASSQPVRTNAVISHLLSSGTLKARAALQRSICRCTSYPANTKAQQAATATQSATALSPAQLWHPESAHCPAALHLQVHQLNSQNHSPTSSPSHTISNRSLTCLALAP